MQHARGGTSSIEQQHTPQGLLNVEKRSAYEAVANRPFLSLAINLEGVLLVDVSEEDLVPGGRLWVLVA